MNVSSSRAPSVGGFRQSSQKGKRDNKHRKEKGNPKVVVGVCDNVEAVDENIIKDLRHVILDNGEPN